ncbi:hypothetical protein RNI52_18865 [Labrys neptuniae]|uniref:hypothetical protein n=2 Tax=Labrys TaxID=204476 RepID=UPI002891D5CF|nr:hypothetical protein [Labrys neptuniae]MDT3379402.1 hypothetical protein [Labrys neptuniae]
MTRFIAALLALLCAGPAFAQAQARGTPTLSIDKSGSSRCLYLWDLDSSNATDKGVPFGCLDEKGAWNLPATLRNVTEIDETTLRGFGYRGDGIARTLSSVTSLNGRPTSGWTLSQWQAILPAATSLGDYLDWAIFQSLIDANANGKVTFTLGAGTARFNRALKACSQTLTIAGAGDKQTVLQYDGGVNGIEVCVNSPDTGRTQNPIFLSDLELRQTTPGNTAIGLYGKWIPGSIGGKIDNVRVDNFNQAIEVWSAGGWDINHLFASSGVPAGGAVGDGFRLMGNSVFVVHIDNSQTQGFADGWHFENAADYGNPASAGMEDIALRNSASGEGRACVRIKSTDHHYSPLHWNIENMACQAYEGFVQAEQAGALRIIGGSWILARPTGSWTGVGKDWFLFGRVETGVLRDAHISNNAQAMTISSYVRLANAGPFGGSAHNVTVDNNKFEYANLTATNAQIWKEFEAVGTRVMNNQFVNAWSYQPLPPANAFKWVDNATRTDSLVRAAPGEIYSLAGSVTGMASATATDVASVSLPPGMWTCSSNIYLSPTDGASISVIQAGLNTTSAKVPLTPALGSITEAGTWKGGVSRALTSWTFDFTTATANTNVYLVGLAAYSGGSVNVSNSGQCIRLR